MKSTASGAKRSEGRANANRQPGRARVVHWQSSQGTRISGSELIHSLEAGLPFAEFEELQRSLELSADRLAALLGLSRATLHRRKGEGRLNPQESDRVVRVARLLGQAAEALESLEAARRWLSSPQAGLGGAIPLQYAGTEVGGREVEQLLGRIEYGVYS